MKRIDSLTNGSLIRVNGIQNRVEICTLSAFAAKGNETIEYHTVLDTKFNRVTQWAWTYQAPGILTADYPGKQAALDAERTAIAAAPVVETGDELIIDGDPYIARVLGNYSDPVKLTKISFEL